jgi:hypothetical protein
MRNLAIVPFFLLGSVEIDGLVDDNPSTIPWKDLPPVLHESSWQHRRDISHNPHRQLYGVYD